MNSTLEKKNNNKAMELSTKPLNRDIPQLISLPFLWNKCARSEKDKCFQTL